MRRTYNRFFLSDEHPIADAQVLDEVVVRVEVELNLEVSASVLLRRLRVLVGNNEVVHDSFLKRSVCAENLRLSSALGRGWFGSV